MPTGKEPGLDRRHWQDLDPNTAIAQRRDSTTGIEARSYSQVTAPKTKSTEEKVNPKDPGALLLLSDPPSGVSKEEVISRIKMDTNEGKAVGKADEEETVVKQEINQSNDEEILDDELEHVICCLFYPKSDAKSTRMRKIFLQQDITKWDEFIFSNKQDFQAYGLSPPALNMIHQLLQFVADRLIKGQSTDNPCKWTYKMWNKWRKKQLVASVSSHTGRTIHAEDESDRLSDFTPDRSVSTRTRSSKLALKPKSVGSSRSKSSKSASSKSAL